MPRLISNLSRATLFLAVALVLVSTSTLLAQPRSPKPALTRTWVLTQVKVVNSGKTSTTSEGTLTTGYVVQAAARSQGAKKTISGTFTINCSIEEKGGIYYLRGAWDITRVGAPRKTHNTPNSMKGSLMAELPFNPATTTGTINAKTLATPKRRHGGNEVKAEGTFSGNEKFGGTLTLASKK